MFLMQARSSVSLEIVTWVTAAPDWTGVDFPGPGVPEHVSATFQPGGGGGQSSTTFTLSDDSADLVAGDAFCSANDTASPDKVTKAVPAALVNAKGIIGFAPGAVPGGGTFDWTSDPVPRSVSGLGDGASAWVGITSGARARRISNRHGGEIVAGFCDGKGNVFQAPEPVAGATPTHDLNPFAFGAVGDGIVDDAPAFQAAIDSMGLVSGDDPGKRMRLRIPSGKYRFANPVRVTNRVLIEGQVDGGVTIFTDDWKSGFVFFSLSSSGTGGAADRARIHNIDFVGGPGPVNAPKWAPNHAYAKGDRILPKNYGVAQGRGRFSWEYHYECIKAGTSKNSSLSPANIATGYAWLPSNTTLVGDVVTTNWTSGTNPGRTDVLFACTARSSDFKTGSSQPASFLTAVAGDVITDNHVTWTAFTPGEPSWDNVQNPCYAEPWTANTLVGYGTLVRCPDSLSRYDIMFTCRHPTVGVTTQQLTGSAVPAGFATAIFGDLVSDANSIQWRAWATGGEAIPGAYQTGGHVYARNDKVIGVDGQAWVCKVGGTSGGSTPSQFSTGFIPPWTEFTADGITWRSYSLGETMTYDNGVVWACRSANAITSLATIFMDHINSLSYPNAAIHLQGDVSADEDNGLGQPPAASPSGCRGNNIWALQCGVGVLTRGGDSSASTFYDVFVSGSSSFPPQHIEERGICDRGFLGSRWFVPTIQFVGGPGLMGTGAHTGGFYGIYLEAVGDSDLTGAGCSVIGGTQGVTLPVFGLPTDSNMTNRSAPISILPEPRQCRNIVSPAVLSTAGADRFGVSDFIKYNTDQGFTAQLFGVKNAGWWESTYYSEQQHGVSWQESTAMATEGYGIFQLPRGFFLGYTGTERFFFFPGSTASKDPTIMAGLRKVGFVRYLSTGATPGGYFGQVVTTEGIEGTTWATSTAYTSGTASGVLKRSGDIVAPTDTSNTNRFLCTTGGTSGGVEPTWSSAPSLNDTFTDSDGVHWKNIGTAAVWSDAFEVKDPATSTVTQPATDWSGATPSHARSRATRNTYSDASTHTLDSITVPDLSMSRYTAMVEAKINGSADGATFSLSSAYARNGGSPVAIRAPAVDTSDANLAGSPLTAVLDISSNDVRVRVTDPDGRTVHWTVFWQAAEGL